MGFLEPRHEALRSEARAAFAALEATPAREADGGEGARLHQALAELGLYRHYPVDRALDVRAICVLREELAARSAAADSIFAVQGLGSHPLRLTREPALRELLERVSRGNALFAFALTEPEAGSDVGALSTRARRDGDHYVLEGQKRFISNAGIATHYTVFARTAEGKAGVSAFLVEAGTPGLEVDTSMELLSPHPLGALTFRGCRVPVAARLGAEGAGMKLALATLDTFRTTVGAAALGMARRAHEEAVAHVRQRRQFGAPLAELQGVQFLLAESAVELDASRLLVERAAAAKDGGQERIGYEAATAKLFATEAAQRIIDRSLQLHGGVGVVKGSAVERLYRDIRALRIYEGATEVQKLVIARHLLAPR